MISIEERVGAANNMATFKDYFNRLIRVAIPGIVTKVNADRQTVNVQAAIREKINIDGNDEWVEIPELQEVPLFVNRGGNYALTLPVKVGDECLVVFADMCIDAWWQSGGIQNQIERRRHDLSDSFAIVGFTSQAKKLPNYSTSTAQLRTLDGSSYIELSAGQINIVGNVHIQGTLVTSGDTIAAGISLDTHTHGGVTGGPSSTGGPQ